MRRANIGGRAAPSGQPDGPRVLLCALTAVACCWATAAFAADPGGGKPSQATFLIEILILVVAGRLLGEAMQRIGQPSVMGQLIAGILLGPSVFGLLWPDGQHAIFPSGQAQKGMIDAVAQVGVLMLLLLAGMETDLNLARRTGRASIAVSVTGICLPFACGFGLGLYLPDSLLPNPNERLPAALMLGTALSISSVKIVAMVVREMNFLRRNVGQIILASAVIDDTIGWILIAITLSLVEQNHLDWPTLAKSVLGTAIFLGVSFTVGRRLVAWAIRWTNDNFTSELPVISFVLALTFCLALITDAIGVHDVLGAFVAGILVGESPILTKQIDGQLRGLITGLFMPVFFGLAGLTADLTILKDPEVLLLTIGIVAIATIGKFSGAFAGGTIGGLRFKECFAIASGMNARGSTEVIVATIGLSMGVLSQNLFSMIVTMAILTTLAMPPMLRWSLARLPMREEEKKRIEREEFEAKGFMPNVERLLLAVDDSANGKFAAHLTGLLAGRRGTPTTLLRLREPERENDRSPSRDDQDPAEDLKAGAEVAREAKEAEERVEEERSKAEMERGSDGEDKPSGDAVQEKQQEKQEKKEEGKAPKTTPQVALLKAETGAIGIEEAIAREATKGYDLLILGVQDALAADGALHEDLGRITAGFDGPLSVVLGRGRLLEKPTTRLRILVPVSGNNVSRRAAEVAVMLARAQDMPITFLYVTGGRGKNGGGRGHSLLHRHEQAALKELVTWAERYDTEARTAIRMNMSPQDAILRELKTGRYDLVVMGVNRRPGEALFFGNVAGSVIEGADTSLMLLSS
jgi:Kef-type K+ transport system membrane component KefB/nucleotide-binding universal stress UspA family protein